MDFHNVLIHRRIAFAEDATMTKDCMLPRYQIYILTSCEFVDDLLIGVSIDFWESWMCTCRLPYSFVVLQQLYFRRHGIDASAFLRMDWVVDEHCEDVSLPERPW